MEEKQLKCIMAAVIYAGMLTSPDPLIMLNATDDAATKAKEIYDAVYGIEVEEE